MINPSNYSIKFRKIRTQLSITQSEFAEKLGIQQANLSAIELGKRNPTLDMIDSLINKFNISPDYIHLDQGQMFREQETVKEENLEELIERKVKEILAREREAN
jgi:transcriptional regulator with XRE-family HTH domain